MSKILIILALIISLAAQALPVIVEQPADQAVALGVSAILQVTVSATGPFDYQWLIGGTNVPQLISSVAGNGNLIFSGDGGAATNATLNGIGGVAVGVAGNLFIADINHNRIRKVGTNGIITTVAGNGASSYSGDGNLATNVGLAGINCVAADAAGNFYFSDAVTRVFKVGTNGIITTVAGTGSFLGDLGDGGLATNATLDGPAGVAVDNAGNLFIADGNHNIIRKVATNGIITTVAGNGDYDFTGDDGFATNATFNGLNGVAVDGSGNLFITDLGNNRIRKVGTNGIISTVAGNGDDNYTGDGGAATNAALSGLNGVAVDNAGNLFITDNNNNYVRRVSPNGVISTVAGNGNNFVFFSGDGGAATNAALRGPNGVAVDGAGNLFIADNGNNRVRKMNEACLASLALDRVSGAQAGNYAVVITDYSGSITSRLAVLNVFLRLNHFTTSVSGNVLHVDLSGESNFAYILQTATNLAPPLSWQSVYTNSADVNGDWHYTNNVGGPQCFYRVTAQ